MKHNLIAFALVGLVVLAAGVSVGALLRHEPHFYRQATIPPGELRKQRSREFQAACVQLMDYVINQERQWQVELTADQINSYLDEDFARNGKTVETLPEGISEPRVAIEPDRIRLAFRWELLAGFSTVVAIDICPWLPTNEPNVVALKIQSVHLGALPVTTQSLLERISEVARRRDVDVTWYRHQGQPVALLRFEADQKRPTVQLRQLELHHGRLLVAGAALPRPTRDTVDARPVIRLN
ncbi:MAG: hypothetical protein NZ700_05240 [Gemmataceae bacterium]|nr:hypothetical protein [Gemmataceae bacterium]MDW8263867.1 hypothetical protein [Gemmataceae bacterium]